MACLGSHTVRHSRSHAKQGPHVIRRPASARSMLLGRQVPVGHRYHAGGTSRVVPVLTEDSNPYGLAPFVDPVQVCTADSPHTHALSVAASSMPGLLSRPQVCQPRKALHCVQTHHAAPLAWRQLVCGLTTGAAIAVCFKGRRASH